MEKNIKDYLHLYLGCEGRVSVDYGPPMRGMKIVDCVLIGIVGEIVTLECYDIHGKKWESEHISYYSKFKPMLRPLSDMTEEENVESGKFQYPNVPGFKPFPDKNLMPRPELFRHLLSKHFDLFGLIESGLAIDKTNCQINTL